MRQPCTHHLQSLIADFVAFTGLPDSTLKTFSVHTLFELCDRNLERAVDMYLSSPEDVRQMCPPTAAPQTQARVRATTYTHTNT